MLLINLKKGQDYKLFWPFLNLLILIHLLYHQAPVY